MSTEQGNGENKDERRRALETQWHEIKAKAEELRTWNASVATKLSEISDAADLGIRAAQHGFEAADWESSIEDARRFNQSLNGFSDMVNVWVSLQPAVSTAGTLTIQSSSELVARRYLQDLPVLEQQVVAQINSEYAQFFKRYAVQDEVLELMNKCGLDKRTKGAIAVEKFKNAWALYTQSPPINDPAIGSLVSLREAINRAIDDINDRKPKQKETKAKIKDIGEQLAVESLPRDLFEDLATRHTDLIDQLSGAKDKLDDRGVETELMHKGTFFLRALLSAIDPMKMR